MLSRSPMDNYFYYLKENWPAPHSGRWFYYLYKDGADPWSLICDGFCVMVDDEIGGY